MAAPDVECSICFDTIPSIEARSLCAQGHRFCTDCCWRCCQSSLGDGLVPACPNDKEAACGTIPKEAAEAALSRWLLQKGEQQSRKAELQAAGWTIRGSQAAGFTSGKLGDVYLSAERARQGAVQCIGKRCKEWLVPPVPHSPMAQRLVCSEARCGASFCAACRHPYHFRSTCAEALRINARWVRFLQTELGAFLMAAVRAEPERYGPMLKAYTRAKSALDDATRRATARTTSPNTVRSHLLLAACYLLRTGAPLLCSEYIHCYAPGARCSASTSSSRWSSGSRSTAATAPSASGWSRSSAAATTWCAAATCTRVATSSAAAAVSSRGRARRGTRRTYAPRHPTTAAAQPKAEPRARARARQGASGGCSEMRGRCIYSCWACRCSATAAARPSLGPGCSACSARAPSSSASHASAR